jgi:hypothetical protein
MNRPPKKIRGYLARVAKAYEKAGPTLAPPGSLSNVYVAHDSWCRSYKGKSCNCYPDIQVQLRDGRYTIDMTGSLKLIHPN